MCPPSPRRLRTAALATATTLITVPAVALAQRTSNGFETGTETATATPWYVQAIITGGLTLVIGGLLVAVAPHSTRRRTDRALEQPGVAFVYGVVSLAAVIGLSFLLAITGIGIVLAIPLLLFFVLIALVAGEYGYLAVGRLASDSWPLALGVAVAVAALVGAVPILGGIVGFVISSIGMGTVVREFIE